MSRQTNKDHGKYVSRSTYQKVVEENKRLKQDIKDLTTRHYKDARWLEVYTRWWRHFKKEHDFMDTLRAIFDPASPLYGGGHLPDENNRVSPQSPKTS
jgi:hypothetical protein